MFQGGNMDMTASSVLGRDRPHSLRSRTLNPENCFRLKAALWRQNLEGRS